MKDMLVTASVAFEAQFTFSPVAIRSVEPLPFSDDSTRNHQHCSSRVSSGGVRWPGASGDSVVFADHTSVYKPKSSSGVLVTADRFGELIGTKELSHSRLIERSTSSHKIG